MDELKLRGLLANPDELADNIFDVLQSLSKLANDQRTLKTARELVIRALAVRDSIPSDYIDILESLIRSVGLFPYADSEHVTSLEDHVLLEAHRAPGLGSNNFFHRLQLDVYRELITGRNVVLSATTSVGKTRVVDAILASQKHKCVAIIVPTIALIDETRRRLTQNFGESHDIITHPSQVALGDGRPTIYVLTQERALARKDLNLVEFVVIDEFYKLDLRDAHDERAIDLNLCFHRFAENGAQFYLLGPNINAVEGLPARYKHSFMPSEFATVAVDIEIFKIKRDEVLKRNSKLVEICRKLQSPTLIYCQSPQKARDAAEVLMSELALPESDPKTKDAVDWLEQEFPSEWIVTQALKKGIGIHHGNVPRSIQQYMVRAFEQRLIRFLVCTSTIIEGVNTIAENVIIYDKRINNSNLDYFTFKNIAGRAGRMKHYYVGKVFVLEEPPAETHLAVQLPIENQTDATPMSLLLDLPDTSLAERSRQRLAEAFAASPLSPGTIKANRYVPIQSQDRLYYHIRDNSDVLIPDLTWRGVPEPQQLKAVCNLIFKFVDEGARLHRHRVFSGDALHAELIALRVAPNFRGYIDEKVQSRWDDESVTDAIERVLKFLRNYVGYAFGRQLMAVSRIQAEALSPQVNPRKLGDYSLFAAQADSLFLPSGLYALDEYGLPPEIARRLAQAGQDYSTLDAALHMVASVDVNRKDMHPFEREIIKDVQSALPARARRPIDTE
ncbi:DEAD/DEAH box helicase [Methylobacterium sp. ARG-1]|uniref:DEAD/DEAH box helicase n=1 Tax=Methylobacterium sp. ARG-1 TaxID=1692501 RepID=UPI000AB6027A|nr:DEAD/DEAH box helicase [Methylobacterium sp. ARG-1]